MAERKRPARITIAELRRLERALGRFEEKVEAAYPGFLRGDGPEREASHDMSETVRNALTALAHVSGWINYRLHNGGDPYEDAL